MVTFAKGTRSSALGLKVGWPRWSLAAKREQRRRDGTETALNERARCYKTRSYIHGCSLYATEREAAMRRSTGDSGCARPLTMRCMSRRCQTGCGTRAGHSVCPPQPRRSRPVTPPGIPDAVRSDATRWCCCTATSVILMPVGFKGPATCPVL